ncbi:MAG: 50S ribosomal protein L23 [Pseudomonadota bacterium]
MAKVEKAIINEKAYITLTRPIVTEKSMMGSQYGQITFKVPVDATKPDVKAAVEAIYGVKVTAVNTVLTKGKTKRFKGILGRRSDSKKAIVTLAEGQTIDLGLGA